MTASPSPNPLLLTGLHPQERSPIQDRLPSAPASPSVSPEEDRRRRTLHRQATLIRRVTVLIAGGAFFSTLFLLHSTLDEGERSLRASLKDVAKITSQGPFYEVNGLTANLSSYRVLPGDTVTKTLPVESGEDGDMGPMPTSLQVPRGLPAGTTYQVLARPEGQEGPGARILQGKVERGGAISLPLKKELDYRVVLTAPMKAGASPQEVSRAVKALQEAKTS